MDIADIKVGSLYKIDLGHVYRNLPPQVGSTASSDFCAKYKTWGQVSGNIVKVLSKSIDIMFCIISDPDTTWANIRPSFFSHQLAPDNKSAAGTKAVVVPAKCQCNIWISGCKCGAFKAEKK